MVLILDAVSQKSVCMLGNLCYMTCLRHLLRSRSVTNSCFPPNRHIFLCATEYKLCRGFTFFAGGRRIGGGAAAAAAAPLAHIRAGQRATHRRTSPFRTVKSWRKSSVMVDLYELFQLLNWIVERYKIKERCNISLYNNRKKWFYLVAQPLRGGRGKRI